MRGHNIKGVIYTPKSCTKSSTKRTLLHHTCRMWSDVTLLVDSPKLLIVSLLVVIETTSPPLFSSTRTSLGAMSITLWPLTATSISPGRKQPFLFEHERRVVWFLCYKINCLHAVINVKYLEATPPLRRLAIQSLSLFPEITRRCISNLAHSAAAIFTDFFHFRIYKLLDC